MTYWQGTVIDTAVWSVHTEPVASVTQDDAALIHLGTGDAHCGGWIVSNSVWDFTANLEINFEVFYPASIDYNLALGASVAFGALAGSREGLYARCTTGILMTLRRDGTNPSRMTKYINGSGSTVTSTSYRIPTDTYCDIKITLIDGVISVYHDDILMYSWTITSDIITACGGSFQIEFGAGTYNRAGTVIFRNLTLSSDIPPVRVTVEYYTALRIASVAEAFHGLQTSPTRTVERWQAVRIERTRYAEKLQSIYIDTTSRLELAKQLQVDSVQVSEVAKTLGIKGSLLTAEGFASLSITAQEREIYEVYQQLAILNEIDPAAFEFSAVVLIDGSGIEYIDFKEQAGLFFKKFEVQVDVSPDTDPPLNVQLIKSLPLFSAAKIILLSSVLTVGGPVVVVSREIELMYDGVDNTTISLDANTAAEIHTAVLRLVSPTAGLGWLAGDAGARRITKTFTAGTLASEILTEIFAEKGLQYDLRIDDFLIGQDLEAAGLFPHEIWPNFLVVEDIYTGDDGETLIIAPQLPCLPDDFAAISALELDASEFVLQSDQASDGGQILYNSIRVANFQDVVGSGAADLAPPEIGKTDEQGITTVHGWPVPWRRAWLRGSHIPHDGYELRAEGVEETLELEEIVQFDGGTGKTARPIFAMQSIDWMGNTPLGILTPSEDGNLTAEVKGKSVAMVRYSTRRWNFIFRDAEKHTWSLWLTDQED